MRCHSTPCTQLNRQRTRTTNLLDHRFPLAFQSASVGAGVFGAAGGAEGDGAEAEAAVRAGERRRG